MVLGFLNKIFSSNKNKREKDAKVPYYQRDPFTWSTDDVCLWLSSIGLSSYMETFKENDITGEELMDLKENELRHLGIEKYGHQKKILSKLRKLKDNSTGINSSDSYSEVLSEPENSSSGELIIKCNCESDIYMIVMNRSDSVDHLMKLIEEEIFKKRGKDIPQQIRVKFMDTEGDMVTLKNDNDLRAALSPLDSLKTLKLWIYTENSTPTPTPPLSPTTNNKGNNTMGMLQTTSILDSLVDGAIIMDANGIITYVNEAIEKLFQYQREELLNYNISKLMPKKYAKEHDQYILRYLQTRNSNIIGKTRKIHGVRKDGTHIPILITVNENDDPQTHGFVATIRPGKNEEMNKVSSSSPSSSLSSHSSSDPLNAYRVIEGLLEAAIVTNSTGTVVYVNQSAQKLLEFKKKEFIGKNIKCVFPNGYESHDDYIADYIKTGGSKLCGSTRDLVMQTKNGALVPVTVSMSKDTTNTEDKTPHFLAIIRQRNANLDILEKSALQQEREVIDNLALPGIIINEERRIQAFNKAAANALGYTLMEVLGQNVRMLMPEGEIKRNHDSYVLNYIRTGEAKIIGTSGREITAQAKDGTLVTVWASVTERKLSETKRIFTAILHPKK